MTVRIAGVGTVTLEELEARLSAYLNAGAPEPVLEGTSEDRREVRAPGSRRGASQMKALVRL